MLTFLIGIKDFFLIPISYYYWLEALAMYYQLSISTIRLSAISVLWYAVWLYAKIPIQKYKFKYKSGTFHGTGTGSVVVVVVGGNGNSNSNNNNC